MDNWSRQIGMAALGSFAERLLLAKISSKLPVSYQVRAALAVMSGSGWIAERLVSACDLPIKER